MIVSASADTLTLSEAARIMREAVRDKTYQLYPLGMEAAAYLRMKRKRLTKGSFRKYEAALDKLARHFPAQVLGRHDMRVKYEGDPDAPIDPGSEPARAKCPTCGQWADAESLEAAA